MPRFALGNLKQSDSRVEARNITQKPPQTHPQILPVVLPTSPPALTPPASRGPAVRTGSLLLERRKQKSVVAKAATAVRSQQSRNVLRHTSHHDDCAEYWSLFPITHPH
jgi:hypothetical protein